MNATRATPLAGLGMVIALYGAAAQVAGDDSR